MEDNLDKLRGLFEGGNFPNAQINVLTGDGVQISYESAKKNAFAALDLLEEKKPEILITCGTDDQMFSRNELLVDKLKKHQIRYEPIWLKEGKHDSDCFRDGLWRAAKRVFER